MHKLDIFTLGRESCPSAYMASNFLLAFQELVGPVPEGYDGYFANRFPRLLIEVYNVICKHCKEEECFQRYF